MSDSSKFVPTFHVYRVYSLVTVTTPVAFVELVGYAVVYEQFIQTAFALSGWNCCHCQITVASRYNVKCSLNGPIGSRTLYRVNTKVLKRIWFSSLAINFISFFLSYAFLLKKVLVLYVLVLIQLRKHTSRRQICL